MNTTDYKSSVFLFSYNVLNINRIVLKADILGSPHNSSQFNTAKCKVRVYRSVTRDEINEVCN